MFQVLRFKEDPETHHVSAMVEYEWKDDKDERKEKSFSDPKSAWVWINQERKTYILAKLKSFILHKKIMSDSSPQWSIPTTHAKKLRSLEIMLREYEIISGSGLMMIAQFIQRCYKHLANILPTEQHVTFLKQKQILQQIWEFACEVNPNSGIKQETEIE